MNLEEEIIALKERNLQVEADKKWETSFTRKFLIAIITYFLILLFFYIGEFPDPFLSAIVPTLGFLLSTFSFPFFKKIWKKYFYQNPMSNTVDLLSLPKTLPKSLDSGECDHLEGMNLPNIDLSTTSGNIINFSDVKKAVIFIYPMTGRPDENLPKNWDDIPGARGCTPQACSFRDNLKELKTLDYQVFGLSVQNSDYQKEAAQRLHLNYDLVSDENFLFQKKLSLPTFSVEEKKLLQRVTLIIENGIIIKKFFPVFPTHKNIFEVIKFLKANT